MSFLLTITLVGLGFLSRFIPHPANATALGAISLIAGRYLPRRYAWGVPIAAMLISDFALGGYELGVMLSVYLSFGLVVGIGQWLRRSPSLVTWFGATVGVSTLFFLITNFAVWAFGAGYSLTGSGLLASYGAALPFWRNMLLGDLAYVTILLGLARLFCAYDGYFTRRFPALLRGIQG